MYFEGKGVEQDDYQTFFWVKKAAEQGLTEAQCILGIMYFYGQGVATNYVESFKWLKLGAQNGCQSAIKILRNNPNIFGKLYW